MASKINKGEILAKFFDDGEYTALFADGAVSAACGYAAGQQAYAVYQNGEAVTVKDVEIFPIFLAKLHQPAAFSFRCVYVTLYYSNSTF